MSDKHFASVKLLLGFEGSDGSTTFVDDGATGHTVSFVPPQGPFSRYKALGVTRAVRPAAIGMALEP